jgi:hypothetical protein
VIAVVFVLLISTLSHAAVAVNGVSTANAYSAAVSFAHNTGSGSDRFLAVCVTWQNSGSTSNTGASYNAVAMTEWGRATSGSADGDAGAALWYLVNPTAGSNTVATTFNNLPNFQAASAISFTGVHQTTPIRTASTASGTSSAPSVSPTSALNDLVLDCLGVVDNETFDVVITVGSGQTQRWNHSRESVVFTGGSTEPGAASTTTMSWTVNQSEQWAFVAGAIRESVTSRRRIRNVYP